MRRTGIDLSSIRCNVVDADASGRRRKGEPATLRVHRFASITHLDNVPALTADAQQRAKAAAVLKKVGVTVS